MRRCGSDFRHCGSMVPLLVPTFPFPRGPPLSPNYAVARSRLLPRLAVALVGDGPARRVLAASDPDGHGLIFAEALTPGRRTATSDASATNDRTRTKGNPCSTPKSRTSPSSSWSRTLPALTASTRKPSASRSRSTDFEGGYLQARLPGDVEFVFLPGEAPRGATPQVVFGLAKGGSTRWSPRSPRPASSSSRP